MGSVAGYFGRGVDTCVMRAADAFLSVPALFLILIVVALFGASLLNTTLVIALVTWAPVARMVRAECLSLRAASSCTPRTPSAPAIRAFSRATCW